MRTNSTHNTASQVTPEITEPKKRAEEILTCDYCDSRLGVRRFLSEKLCGTCYHDQHSGESASDFSEDEDDSDDDSAECPNSEHWDLEA